MRTFSLALLLLACTPSETLPDCTPGATVACACVGGGQGAQTCSTGRAYGACVCPDGGALDVPGVDVAADVATQDTAPDAAMDSGGVDAVDVVSEFGGDAQAPDAASDVGAAETESDTGTDAPADIVPDAISCPVGRADCDGIGANGCEIDVQTDRLNCGRCTNVCVNPDNATGVCSAGACNLRCIGSVQMNCDGMIANGCEADTRNDARNCGGCGVSCGARSCVMGRCN